MSEPQTSTTSAGQLTGLPPRTIRAYTGAWALFAAFLVGKGMPAATAGIRREHVEPCIVGRLRANRLAGR
jgi:hypothetical protein